MGRRKNKINPKKEQSLIKKSLNKRLSAKDLIADECFILSFKHLDRNQSDSLKDWESKNILAHAMEVLGEYCKLPLTQQIDKKKFVLYGAFPKKSDYSHPKHVPEDAEWARIHVTGTQVVAGHIVQNKFYVVFLDSVHGFYKTKKKHT